MIEELRIAQLGVIDSSELELGPGLTVITGETGAGKTMVVTALGLLLGNRSDAGAVRTGAKSARVEGVVDVSSLPGTAEVVDRSGGTIEDDRVLLARSISAEGRSRAFVGGAGVPVSGLAEVSQPLVAVHGQSDQHRLLKAAAQRDALDRFGGETVQALLRRWQEQHAELVRAEQTLTELVDQAQERARRAELLRFGLGEVEAVDPQPGESDELAAEEARLGHADELRTAAEAAREALSSDDPTALGDALSNVGTARNQLESVSEHDTEARDLAQRLAEVSYLLSDLAADIASYAAGIDVDPARLSFVSERRAALTGLTRKYGETIDDVLTWARDSAAELLDLDGSDERIEELRGEISRLRGELAGTGAELTEARVAAAQTLGEEVTAELSLLAMPHAVLTIEVKQHPIDPPSSPDGGQLQVGDRWLRATATGLDEVEFLLAANTGSDPRPLAKGASGGELSRVMLALEVRLAATSPVPTFVFDEVDAGVGGKAAIEVGRRLAELARSAQVLVVTHLPQVAAYADRHVVVSKERDGSITTSGLTTLDDEGRVRELSRMMAGVDESDSALAHARELLEAARVGG